MSFYWLLIGALAVWRITHLLEAEDGPWDLMARLRRRADAGFWGTLLNCFYCLSLWVSAPVACLIGQGWLERIILWPALSAAAILIEHLAARMEGAPPAVYHEDPEESDGVLRKTETTDQTGDPGQLDR